MFTSSAILKTSAIRRTVSRHSLYRLYQAGHRNGLVRTYLSVVKSKLLLSQYFWGLKHVFTHDSVLIWALSAGIAQGIFLSVALFFLDARNRDASRMLAGLVAIMTFMIAAEFLDVLGAPFDLRIGLANEFATAPLIFLFMRSISDPTSQLKHRQAYHFLPLAIALAVIVTLQVCCGEKIFSHSNAALMPIIATWTLVKIPYFFTYAYLSDRLLLRALKTSRRRRARALRWVRMWFLTLWALISLTYANFIFFISGFEFAPEPDFLGAILIAATIFSVAYFIIANRRILDSDIQNNEDFDRVAQQAISYLEANRLYLDPNFSLPQLATLLGVKETLLSQALSAQYDGGFHEFINQRRIVAFDGLLQEVGNRERTILDLSMEAGFNSKATFYRAFKSIKGTTPSHYRARLTE